MKRAFVIVAMALLATSCGKYDGVSSSTQKFKASGDSAPDAPMTLDKLFNTASVECENKTDCNASIAALYFVDKFEVEDQKWTASWEVCTGSVVESNTSRMVIMTNRHCLKDKFVSTMTCPRSQAIFTDHTHVTCRKILWISSIPALEKYDVAFIEYTPAPQISVLPMTTGSFLSQIDTYVRRGFYFTDSKAKLSRASQETHSCKRKDISPDRDLELSIDVDCNKGTVGGFSGSPMFSGSKIVGLHHAGSYLPGDKEKKARSRTQTFVSFECLRGLLSFESGFTQSLAKGCANGPI